MKLLALTLLAAPLFAGTIQVNGGGTFEIDREDLSQDYTAVFSGSDGIDSLSVNYEASTGGPTSRSISSADALVMGVATVDGTVYGPNFFTFQLFGDGSSGFVSEIRFKSFPREYAPDNWVYFPHFGSLRIR